MTSMPRPELRLVRETLESVLAPNLASATLFEALEAFGGTLPNTPSDVLAFVQGPLLASLRRRHGGGADPLIADLARILAPTDVRRDRDLEITREVPLESQQVLVFVLSTSDGLATKIEVALGTHRVATLSYDEAPRFSKAAAFRPPSLVLVDCASFPPIEPSAMPALLAPLPPTTVRGLWGTDTPYGAVLMRQLVDAKSTFTSIDRREGLPPILDLIRARSR